MRLPRSVRRTPAILAALLTPVVTHAQSPVPAPDSTTARQAPRARADSLLWDDWGSAYFADFDRAARAAGLTPLREMRLRPGEREVRLWTQVEIAVPKELYRFVDRGSAVRGELIYYWGADAPDTTLGERPGETTHDLMRYTLQGSCNRFAVAEETGVCRARFRRAAPWRAVLRAAEAQGLWTIPDPSALPPDSVMVFDGWTLVAELRDGQRYRTFRYNSPEAHPRWPSAARVQTIARGLNAIDSLVPSSAVRRPQRGVTTGRSGAAFRVCGDTTTWEFRSDLRSLAKHASARIRATLPAALTDTTTRDATGGDTTMMYTVEVIGEVTPPWLARQWGSKFPRVLQVFELRAAQPGLAPDCRPGRLR
jgi:hypothetical protein